MYTRRSSKTERWSWAIHWRVICPHLVFLKMFIICKYTLFEGHLQPLEAGGRQLLWRGNWTAWLIQQEASPVLFLEYPSLSEPSSGKASTSDNAEAFGVWQRQTILKGTALCLRALMMGSDATVRQHSSWGIVVLPRLTHCYGFFMLISQACFTNFPVRMQTGLGFQCLSITGREQTAKCAERRER